MRASLRAVSASRSLRFGYIAPDLAKADRPSKFLVFNRDLDQGLQELRLGPSDFGGVHQGDHLARLDRIAHLLVDPKHAAGNTGRQPGHAGLVVGDLAVARDGFDHRGRPDRFHFDARLLDGLLGHELDAVLVQHALAVVFGPLLKFRPLRPSQCDSSDLWLAFDLGDFRVTKRAVVDPVQFAPAEAFRLGQQVGVALHTLGFRDVVFAAPAALLVVGVPGERRELGDRPSGVVPPYEQAAQDENTSSDGSFAAQPPKHRPPCPYPGNLWGGGWG